MPFILRNKENARILTGMMINQYELPYYGTVYGASGEEVKRLAKRMDEEQIGPFNPSEWEAIAVDDNKLKICNVKLKNDPTLRLYIDNGGQIRVETIR